MNNNKYYKYWLCIILHIIIFEFIIHNLFLHGFSRNLLLYTAVSMCGVMAINIYLVINGSRRKDYFSVIGIPAMLWYTLAIILFVIDSFLIPS